MSDEFGEIVDSIYKTYFTKFWGQEDFNELKQKRLTFQQNQQIYDLLTDNGYKYDLLRRTYTCPHGHPVLNAEYIYENLKSKENIEKLEKE